MQVTRIKQTIREVLDEDKSFPERICTLFREQGITIVSIPNALSMTISTIVFAITGVTGGGRRGGGPPTSGSSPPKDEIALKQWLSKLPDAPRDLLESLLKHCLLLLEVLLLPS